MPSIAEHSGIATLSGTPKDIQAQLARSHAERVLVMTFEHIQPEPPRVSRRLFGYSKTASLSALAS